ncbi:hypothetical protein RhiirA4_536989 [Rhizophagus irregularis]|uniref:CCHC-type domain-containing protein n=1 Tax=Rhizophagus irregularis TaxID=588596 RepID=A0A2I1FUQ8_9GLOM|nr:hypothetical protein RhiirA4_536989 [Rhizophagus irregularis]
MKWKTHLFRYYNNLKRFQLSSDVYLYVIYTDCDLAIANTISFVFPTSKHNLYIFHINLNLKKNVKPKLGLQKFNFELKWKILIEKYSEISKYLKQILELTKESWTTCYINEILIGINSTQRIQNILDNEMKYERINEICKKFLILHILSAIQNQMKYSFFYDIYLVDKDTIQKVNNTNDNKGFREDDYDTIQILLQTIILNIDDKEIALLDVISIVEDHNSLAVVHEEINFNSIHHIRGEQVYTKKLQGIISAKSKYGKVFELLCNQTTNENTAGNQQENIEYSNPVTSRHHGRPPGQYLSEGETLRQNKKQKKTEGNLEVNGNDKKERKCKGCGGTGHDLRNCKRRILSEKN